MKERIYLYKKIELKCPVNCRTTVIEAFKECNDQKLLMRIMAAYAIGHENEEQLFYKRCSEILNGDQEEFVLYKVNVYHDTVVFTFQAKLE